MAAKPKPTLTGTPGNMQDVHDLQQMLANLQEAHDAVVDQVSRFEAERTELRNRIEELEDELKSSRAYHASAVAQLRGVEKDLERATGAGGQLDPQVVRELCVVRRALRDGRNAEGLDGLERALSRLNSSWRVHA